MDHDELTKTLSVLDLTFGKEHEARRITVLRAVLNATEEAEGACTFGDIYERLASGESDLRVSKAWVHRILKSLVEEQLIRLETPDSIRKNYIGTVQTVTTGLETLKEKKGIVLSAKMVQLRKQLEDFDDIECGYIAQELVHELTGKKQILTSRFLRGIDELSRVLKYNIHTAAKEGDIIRLSLMWLGDFGQGLMNRFVKYIDSASQGVETRLLINADVFSSEEAIVIDITMEVGLAMMFKFVELRKQGHKIDVRVYSGAQIYNVSMLNDDQIAMIISENPMTATYVTKEFNPDLIADAVSAFDLTWEKAISIFDLDRKVLEETGLEKSAFLKKILEEASKAT